MVLWLAGGGESTACAGTGHLFLLWCVPENVNGGQGPVQAGHHWCRATIQVRNTLEMNSGALKMKAAVKGWSLRVYLFREMERITAQPS